MGVCTNNILGGVASQGRRGTEGTEAEPSIPICTQVDQINVFFFVSLLMERCRAVKGRRIDIPQRACETVVAALNSATNCPCRETEDTLIDLLLGAPLQLNGSTLFPAAHLLDARHGRKTLIEIGVQNPPEISVWTRPGFLLDSKHIFRLLARNGSLPVRVIAALASLIEDGLRHGHNVHKYEESRVEPMKRARVKAADVAAAANRAVLNPEEGISRACARPVRVDGGSFFKRGLSRLEPKCEDSSDDECVKWLQQSQLCGVDESRQRDAKRYRHVFEHTATLL